MTKNEPKGINNTKKKKNEKKKKKEIKITLEDSNDENKKKVNTEPKDKNVNKPSFNRRTSKEINKKNNEKNNDKVTKKEPKKNENQKEIKPIIKDKNTEIKKSQGNEQKKETQKEHKDGLQKKKTIEKPKLKKDDNLTNDDTIKKSEFIVIIDGSLEIKDHIKNLVNNIIYNFLKTLYNDEEKKILFFAYNSSDIEEQNITIKKLQSLNIEAEGERKINDLFEKIFKRITMKKDNFINILFLTSGKIDLSDIKLTTNINEISTKYKIKLIKYIINQNENYENEEFLNSLNQMIPKNDKEFITLPGDKESNEKNIETLINLFKQ